MIYVYIDGSCVNNGMETAIASWSFVATTKENNILLASTGRVYGNQDNNRAELTAFIRALEYIKNDKERHRREKYIIKTDYLNNCLLFNNEITPKKNLDLIAQIRALLRQCDGYVGVEKVKAHKQENMSNFINGLADALAKENANNSGSKKLKIC